MNQIRSVETAPDVEADRVAEASTEADGAPPVPNYRGLKAAVIIMGVLLVVGFAVLVATIIGRAMTMGDGDAAAPAQTVVQLLAAPGARLVSYQVEGRAVIAHVAHDAGEELVVADWRTGTVLRRMVVTPGTRPPAD